MGHSARQLALSEAAPRRQSTRPRGKSAFGNGQAGVVALLAELTLRERRDEGDFDDET